MSVGAALRPVLFVGFVATGLVGFLGWRQPIREGAGFNAHHPQTVSRLTRYAPVEDESRRSTL